MKNRKKGLTLSLIGILIVTSFANFVQSASAANITAYSPDGKGYLEELTSGKFLMHLEGSPYEMGFQQGYLDPMSVKRLASDDWMREVVLNMLDADGWILDMVFNEVLSRNRLENVVGHVVSSEVLDQFAATSGDSIDDKLYKLLDLCHVLVEYNTRYVPQAFLDEIQGVADGATAAGVTVTYEQVLLLNMGMDALLALAYPVVEPLLWLMDLFAFLSCSGFVAQEDATTNGHTIMGRHWQFTSYVTHEEMIMMEFYPDNGNAFLSTSCAGFVGVTSAMNDQGLGIGNDMVPAQDCDPANFGMGTLLTARYVMQYTNQLSEATNFIINSVHGCSWIYGIGDGRNGETGGVALETSTHYYRIRDMGYKRPWWAIFSPNPIEKKDDLVTYTNHYIYYGMADNADSTGIKDSKNRYEWLTDEALTMYGNIDLEQGFELIDYLHPPSYDYYGSDLTQSVGAAVTCWDLTSLEAKALFGYYNDAPVYASL